MMMSLIVMFGIAFFFVFLMLYCGISLISNFVFGYKEWKIKRRYVNEVLKELAVLPLRWKEERLQKWYALLAIIVCGLIWMPSFVVVMDFDNDFDYEDNVIVNDVIKIEEPLGISEKYGMPEPYYLEVAKKENISELREILKGIKYPHGYEEGVFDCSEMSAYTEWFLENNGFNTSILANEAWGHAWVSVYANGRNVNIECIPLVRITSYEKYNHPEDTYEAIYEAMEGTYSYEWDWWLVK